LAQPDNQDGVTDAPTNDDSRFSTSKGEESEDQNATEKVNKSGDTIVNSPTDESEETEFATVKTVDESATGDTIALSPKKGDVGPNDGTSLGQHDKQDHVDTAVVNDDYGYATAIDKGGNSGDTAVIPPTSEDKKAESKTHEDSLSSYGGETIEKEDNMIVNFGEIDSSEVPLAKTYGPAIAKRLRSSKGEVVPAVCETPKPKKKSSVVVPKKAWSKVVPTAGKSKKRKVVLSSDSDFDVEEDVPNISPSVLKKSVVKKAPQNVEAVATDNVSFHYLENAQRWKFIFYRRLALERELGKEALKCEDVVNLIKEAGPWKIVGKIGPCYEKLVKDFLVNIHEGCDNPYSQEYHKVYVRCDVSTFLPTSSTNFWKELKMVLLSWR
jgi:hypothetical protein